MLIRKHSPDTTAPDPLLSLTSDHCSALGWGWGCHSKTTGEAVPALGAAPLFSPREWPRPCAHVVISLMATGGTSYAPSAGEGREVGTGRVRC